MSKEDPNEGVSFREEAEYGSETPSIKEIILRHIRKISDISCQELTGGYWQKKPIKTSSGVIFTEEYHPDLREAYCNAINFLVDTLYPLGDDELRKYFDSNETINEVEDVKLRIKLKRQTFREINKMFERENFWSSSEFVNE